jgi:ElaB/YqjD/DUF883 family membrane-anchored ribosome-binding protein
VTQITFDDIQKRLTDGVYVGIGLGVIAFQKAQVQRQELRKQLAANVGTARTSVEDRIKTAEERLLAMEHRIDAVLDDVEERLPEQARSVMHQAREVARDTRDQLRELVGRTD